MNDDVFYRVKDVQAMFRCGRGKAYRIIKDANMKLQKKGYMIIPGMVSKKYLKNLYQME